MEDKSYYGQGFIEKLKKSNDIVAVLSKYIKLEKKGKNYWACCPFHHEKTPSFCINEYEQFYHCFGCGESGDVITFLRKYEKMDYPDVIKMLAENSGMKIPELEENEKYIKAKKLKDKCLEILNLAKDSYMANIYKPTALLAQNYIRKRKVGKKELEDFELGYSKDPFELVNFLKAKGYSDAELKASGVCEIGKNGKPYDFLAERLVFPIVNSLNNCIGFSGRDLKNSGMMKYKNTSATLLFDKSKTIYAINLVKKYKQESGFNYIILVEGQFDVVSMHKAGFKNTVACLGTAITKEHIRELKRFADTVILCLDGDDAGQKATVRAIDNLTNSGLMIKAVKLPDKQDPDEFLKLHGPEELQLLIDNAVSDIEFKILFVKEKYNLAKANEKTLFIKEVLNIISKLNSEAEQEIYLKRLESLTSISADILKRDMRAGQVKTIKTQEVISEQDALSKAFEFVLASYLHHKEFANLNSDFIDYLTNDEYKKLFQLISEKEKHNEKFLVANVFDEFDVDNNDEIKKLINFNFDIIENQKDYFNQCLWRILEDHLKFKKSLLSKQYLNETSAQRKAEILKEINLIEKKQKNKKLEEF
ncbi:MAG: DNA primase [Clostridia bacterium]|nr:DNA primase [Clostridia bacterium]